MGTAMTVALGRNAFTVFGVFTAMGVGLATPFLILSWQPDWVRLLPRSGNWMLHLKRIFSIPLFLTVGWLLWVLQQQNGDRSVAVAAIGTVIFSLGLILSSQQRKNTLVNALLTLLILVGVVVDLGAAGMNLGKNVSSDNLENNWSKFDAVVVENAISSGQAVFIDFTAAWCISCQVNKRLVLHSPEVTQFFVDNKIKLFKADYTNYDPEITEALARYGSVGVPLYVVYPAGHLPLRRLPTILTIKNITHAFKGEAEKNEQL